jgi:hypothetical protein
MPPLDRRQYTHRPDDDGFSAECKAVSSFAGGTECPVHRSAVDLTGSFGAISSDQATRGVA